MVQSQWGPVHLFDLCLRFGHLGMAMALAAHSVPGCILEDHHDFGPFSRDPSWDRSGPCRCRGWNTCPYCCWAFPVDQGIWMEDWDADLFHGDQQGARFVGAIPAAHEAAATPLTRAMLEICSRDAELPFSGSPKAMARLLDIAILTGNRAAAVNLSKKCHLRPLRRWAVEWNYFEDCWKAARTALWAGAGFQDLMVTDIGGLHEDVPFPQALFLNCKLELWQAIRHLLPARHDLWRPRNLDHELGRFFLEDHGPGDGLKLSLSKIQAAEDAGLDLQFCFVWIVEAEDDDIAEVVTLLDMAIWCGQPDCAEACVDGGIELKGDAWTLAWHRRVLGGQNLCLDDPPLNVVPAEAETAAEAAGCAWLKRSWKSESSQKRVVLYQMMVKMFKGRSFPLFYVREIMKFSMPVPKIIDQLNLWAHVGHWMESICGWPSRWAAWSASVSSGSGESQISGRDGLDGSGQGPSLFRVIQPYSTCF